MNNPFATVFDLVESSNSDASLMYSRTGDNTITVSAVGYDHRDLWDIEPLILKAGFKYDFSREGGFDKMSGRTFRHFKLKKD